MNIEKVFDSIEHIGKRITDVYQGFLENFYDNPEFREFWEDIIQGEENHLALLNRFSDTVSSLPGSSYETIGRDVDYSELSSIIDQYEEEINKGLDINLALKIAFHFELLEIQWVFNEIIKLPQEPYFEVLSEIHLEIRRNMGRLIKGIERFSTDPAFVKKVMELKGNIIERRSGTDRREEANRYNGNNRRGIERRQGKLVKIACKI